MLARIRIPTITIDTRIFQDQEDQQHKDTNSTQLEDSFLSVPNFQKEHLEVIPGGLFGQSWHLYSSFYNAVLNLANQPDSDVINNNSFAFTPGRITEMITSKSFSAFYTIGGLRSLERGHSLGRVTHGPVAKLSNVGIYGMLFIFLPAKAAASPTGVTEQPVVPPSLLWTSFGQFFMTLTKCGVGAMLGGLIVGLFCSVISIGSKRLSMERDRILNRVQCHSIASLLAVATFVYFLKGEKSYPTMDGSITFGAILAFWTTTHVLFWWEHFQLHQHLNSWHLLMPWSLGAVGIVWSLWSSSDEAITRVPCMFWLPILGWPYLVMSFAKLASFRRHVSSFNYVE